MVGVAPIQHQCSCLCLLYGLTVLELVKDWKSRRPRGPGKLSREVGRPDTQVERCQYNLQQVASSGLFWVLSRIARLGLLLSATSRSTSVLFGFRALSPPIFRSGSSRTFRMICWRRRRPCTPLCMTTPPSPKLGPKRWSRRGPIFSSRGCLQPL